MLGKALLWVIFSNLERDNEVTKFERNKIIWAYEHVENDPSDSNPVKQIPPVATGNDDKVYMDAVTDFGGGQGNNETEGGNS